MQSNAPSHVRHIKPRLHEKNVNIALYLCLALAVLPRFLMRFFGDGFLMIFLIVALPFGSMVALILKSTEWKAYYSGLGDADETKIKKVGAIVAWC